VRWSKEDGRKEEEGGGGVMTNMRMIALLTRWVQRPLTVDGEFVIQFVSFSSSCHFMLDVLLRALGATC